jgi:RNA polymerase sigma-70 factor, ECF subfamily
MARQRLGVRQCSAALGYGGYSKAAEHCRTPKPCGVRPVQASTTFRGWPRRIVATVRSSPTPKKGLAPKSCAFPKVSANYSPLCRRGTASAIWLIRMNDITTASVLQAPDMVQSEDWLTVHGDYLFNLAVGQVRDPIVAEDLVQETFLAAIKARDRFGGRSSDRTWLVGILRHKIYDHLRRVCRERPVCSDHTYTRPDQEAWDESVLWAHEVAEECLEPSRRLELSEFREALETALGQLPPRLAQVFQLYEVEERPNREVCSQLNISESNLWVMLHRARKQLRQELAGWWNGHDGQRSPTDLN